MKSYIFTTIFAVLLAAGSQAQEHLTTVIAGATLIDGTGTPPVADAVVIIRAGRIAKVGTSSSVRIPRDARVINAAGMFLLPGLIDTHVHLEMVGLSDIGGLPARWNTPRRIRDPWQRTPHSI